MSARHIAFWLALLAAASFAAAPARAAGTPGTTPYDPCFDAAARYYGLHPALLKAIARKESGMNPRAVGRNTNGTYDIGIMQINSAHLPKLARAGVTADDLLANPCRNIVVGAWILADAVRRHGLTWKAVGAYHSPTEWRQAKYAADVQRRVIAELRAAGIAVEGAVP